MSLPSAIFLDTSIFAGQNYNFDSTALSTFVPAAIARGVTLLLPDPTEREVRRQIRERSNAALDALNDARRKAPFLSKWTHFPKKAFQAGSDWEVNRLANEQWHQFLGQLSVARLGYDKLDIAEVMNRYDNIRPPFREGKKRKEFPDAFAIALLEAYGAEHQLSIAVVSEDQDFKLACDLAPSLLYFQNLPRLTELLLAKDERVFELRASILADKSRIEQRLAEIAQDLTYYHSNSAYELLRSKFASAEIIDISVVAIGDNECTLTFVAEVEAEHELRWYEESYDAEYAQIDRWILESVQLDGTAKVTLDSHSGHIAAVTFIEFDTSLGDVPVSETPHDRW